MNLVIKQFVNKVSILRIETEEELFSFHVPYIYSIRIDQFGLISTNWSFQNCNEHSSLVDCLEQTF